MKVFKENLNDDIDFYIFLNFGKYMIRFRWLFEGNMPAR